jgi:hypothetical protein
MVRDAGIVHREIEAPVRLYRVLDHGLYACRARHVAPDEAGHTAAGAGGLDGLPAAVLT